MLWLHIHSQLALVLVDDDVLGISFLYILLELGICSVLRVRCSAGERVSTASNEQYCQRNNDDAVYPVHVELGHLWLVAIVHIPIVVVHHSGLK